MKISTKKGDSGTTSLVGGERVSKSDLRLEAYGSIDELDAFVGLLRTKICDEKIKNFLFSIQQKLAIIGGNLATNLEKTQLHDACKLPSNAISALENEIENLEKTLEPLKKFVIPGENEISALCHVCRTVTRRAERNIVRLSEFSAVDNAVKSYINRLSDYFFLLAREFAEKPK